MRSAVLLAFAAFLFVGAWLAVGDEWRRGAADAPRFEWVLDGRKVGVEMRPAPEPEGFEYRLQSGQHAELGWIPASRFQDLLLAETGRAARRHWLLRFFDASSWGNFAWVLVGLAGQLCFFGRMAVQWVASERRGSSVVPPVFWWLSLGGGVCLLGYFVWRLDPIGVLGQSTGVVVYARNLWLLRSPQREGSTPARSAESTARTSASRRSKLA